MNESIVFGPVPSRRLGYSLGVNNVYSKYCSYSCIYCQVGRTTNLTIERRKFYEVEKIVDAVIEAFEETNPDVVTFVPNGEPTLDINLGREAEEIKASIDKPLAILTNSSLVFREDVRRDLGVFDIVSIKVDAVREYTWRRINRPHPRLKLREILEALMVFREEYRGRILSETMIIRGVNDNREDLERIACFLEEIKPFKAYIQSPIRPPAEPWVKQADEKTYLEAYQLFVEKLGSERVELLLSPEPPMFRFHGELFNEILKTIHVHPLRLDYVERLASSRGVDPGEFVDKLLSSGYVALVKYDNQLFLVPKTRK